MRKLTGLAILAAALTVPTAASADVIRTLPTVKRTLTAESAAKRDCFSKVASAARGVDATTYTARLSGFVTVRLAGSDASDWDLALFDNRNGQKVSSSAGYGSHEIAQAWIGSGETLLIQGCLRKGRDRDVRTTIDFVDIAPPKTVGAPVLARVAFKTEEDLARVERLGGDVTHHIHDGEADVILSNKKHLNLVRGKLTDLDFDVEIANLTKHYQRSRAADARFRMRVGKSGLPTGRTNYRTLTDYQNELKAVVEKFPAIAKQIVLPKKTFQGREIQGVELAENVKAPDDGKPVFLLVAMHHAREWPSAESAMEFIHMVTRGYGSDQRITDLLKKTRLIVVPLINVDGFASSRGFVDPVDLVTNQGTGNPTGQGFNPDLGDPDGDGKNCTPVLGCGAQLSLLSSIAPPGGFGAYRRKNCDGAIPDGRVPCELQWGVDPNRNYGFNWGGAGSSGEVFSQSYRGTGPWSEPETQAVHEISQQRQVTNILTIHNVAALVLRPPGTAEEGFAPDEEALKKIGDAMADAAGYTSQYGFQLYDTSGTTEDWNYAQQGAFGYTIEMGPVNGEFHMPYKVGVVDQWEGAPGKGGLRESYMIAWETAADPAYHSVIKGSAPAGRVLRAKKSFVTRTKATCKTEIGFAPFNSPAFWGIFTDFTGEPWPCPEPKAPVDVPDGLETTMTVPADGRYTWHVTPSTRPFVAKPKQTPPKRISEQVIARGGKDLEGQPPSADVDADESNVAVPFTVDTSDGAKTLELELRWGDPPGQDYDLYLCKVSGSTCTPIGKGKSTAPGSSATTAHPELITVSNLQAGDYRARVRNYAGVTNDWTLTTREFDGGGTEPGGRETWTVSCESPDGKTVYETHQVFVDRGEQVTLDMPCGGTPPSDGTSGEQAPAQTGDGEPNTTTGTGAPVSSERGSEPQSTANARTTPKSTKAEAKAKKKRALAKKRKACVRKAKRLKKAGRRKAAVKRCHRNYKRAVKKL